MTIRQLLALQIVEVYLLGAVLDTSDLAEAIGPINLSGNVFSPDDANNNLMIDKSVGSSYAWGSNSTNHKNPSTTTDPLIDQVFFNYMYQDGSGGFTLDATTQDIDATMYDDGSGTKSGVGGVQWTNQRVFYLSDAQIVLIPYGQATYGSQSAALGALETESFIGPAGLNRFLFRGWITVRGNATSDLGNAIFTPAGKFGSGQIATGTDTSTDLQQAYNNSLIGKITTDVTRDSLKIQAGAATTDILDLIGIASENRMKVSEAGAVSGTVVATQVRGRGWH